MTAVPHLVLVLGMHRSGTSLLTAGLAAIGCGLGDFADTPLPENPKGFFEHPAVRAFNDRLLAARGVAWDNWGYDAAADGVAELAAPRAEAAALLRGLFPGPGPHALKDPRIATLLPFWEAVLRDLGWRVTRVLLLRDPAEVAESQLRRAARNPLMHGLVGDPGAAAALWSVTMRTVLASLPAEGALLVAHATLYDRTAAVLRACADAIGLAPDDAAITRFAGEFLDPDLRHAATQAGAPAPGWPEVAAELHAALRPAETPRWVSGAEARQLLAAQARLEALLPFLGAVRHGLGHAGRAAGLVAGRLAALRRAIRALSPAAVQGAGPARLPALLAEVEAVLAEVPDEFAVAACRAELLEKAGALAAAELAWRGLAAAEPGRPLPLRRLAALLRQAGRTAEAEAVAAEFARRFPALPPA